VTAFMGTLSIRASGGLGDAVDIVMFQAPVTRAGDDNRQSALALRLQACLALRYAMQLQAISLSCHADLSQQTSGHSGAVPAPQGPACAEQAESAGTTGESTHLLLCCTNTR
jgi:hypothetical protein